MFHKIISNNDNTAVLHQQLELHSLEKIAVGKVNALWEARVRGMMSAINTPQS
jgi:hypothetical protein